MGTVKPNLKAVPREVPLQVLPVRQAQLGGVWPLVLPGVLECLEGSRGEQSAETVLRDLASGRSLLWLGLSDGKLAGFAITQIVPGNFWSELLLHLVWIAPHAGGNFLAAGLPAIEEHARALGCKQVIFYSARAKTRSGASFGERVSEIGFKPHYVEFVKEL